VLELGELEPDVPVAGPAIVESPLTTIVVDPGATAARTAGGSLAIVPVAASLPEPVGAAA
jgi:N-methylhydantoinase A